jgi:uncharacterized repeat protein (TIGR01451 family)
LIKQLLRGAFHPNDKFEIHEGSLIVAEAQKGEYLNYIIRFQNTGTDTVFRIAIKDTLDKAINISSVLILAWSHPYQFSANISVRSGWQEI